MSARISDPKYLVQPLRDDLPFIEADMAALGHEIVIIETARSPERAEMLEAKGTSKTGDRSLHCWKRDDGEYESYAVDLGNKRGIGAPGSPRAGKADWWSDWILGPDGKPLKTTFFPDLETVAIKRGWFRLFSAGVKHDAFNKLVESWDGPHIQAIPVKQQNRLRAMSSDARLVALLAMRIK